MSDEVHHLADKSLLLLDDDTLFRTRLSRAMASRGFVVEAVGTVREAEAAALRGPAFAVLDLRLEDGFGVQVVTSLRRTRRDCRIVILTSYGNIATAVEAIRAGAFDYLAKPADADQIVKALMQGSDLIPVAPEEPMSADRVRWEHILRVWELCDHNVSETARRLQMHRRTLQRVLRKHAPHERKALEDTYHQR